LIASPPTASAQSAAPAAEAPKHACVKPGEYPGRPATDRLQQAWQLDFAVYTDCIKKFAEAQRALSELHIGAANAAIAEHNAVVRAVNERAPAAAPK
jgi:hypothetical protein